MLPLRPPLPIPLLPVTHSLTHSLTHLLTQLETSKLTYLIIYQLPPSFFFPFLFFLSSLVPFFFLMRTERGGPALLCSVFRVSVPYPVSCVLYSALRTPVTFILRCSLFVVPFVVPSLTLSRTDHSPQSIA